MDLNSIKRKEVSAAYFLTLKGWSKSYPYTTGYIITILLDASKIIKNYQYQDLGFSPFKSSWSIVRI